MGKASRARWEGNVNSMEIIAKDRDKITQEDIDFLRENYTSTGGLLPNAFAGGAFYTPTHVAKFMWDVLKAKGLPANAKVLEPSVGSGVFLEHAPDDAVITGLELDETSSKVTSLLYPNAEIVLGDALTHDRRNYYDVVIGNPPYGVQCAFEPSDGADTWISGSLAKGQRKGKSEVVFIELAIKAVKVGGYIAFVLPKGINFGNYAEKLRGLLHKTCWQVATIELPGETFVHTGTTIPTQILIWRKAPPLPLIKPITTKWNSNFRTGGSRDISEYEAEFLPGQPPAYFAKVTNIGWDKKGKPIPDEDGLTQFDELLEDWADDGLMRENLYPQLPSWHSVGKEPSAFFFTHGNDTGDGHREALMVWGGSGAPLRWNELTLGAGNEFTYEGEEYSSWIGDMELLQDEVVEKWEAV